MFPGHINVQQICRYTECTDKSVMTYDNDDNDNDDAGFKEVQVR